MDMVKFANELLDNVSRVHNDVDIINRVIYALTSALEEIIERREKAWKPMQVFRSDHEVELDEARLEAWTAAEEIAKAVLEEVANLLPATGE